MMAVIITENISTCPGSWHENIIESVQDCEKDSYVCLSLKPFNWCTVCVLVVFSFVTNEPEKVMNDIHQQS